MTEYTLPMKDGVVDINVLTLEIACGPPNRAVSMVEALIAHAKAEERERITVMLWNGGSVQSLMDEAYRDTFDTTTKQE